MVCGKTSHSETSNNFLGGVWWRIYTTSRNDVYVDLFKDIDGMYVDLDMYGIKYFLTHRNLLVQLAFYIGLFLYECMKSIFVF